MKKFYCLLICSMLVATAAFSQGKKPPRLPKFNKNKESNVFLKKQWWLGFKAGVNFADVAVTKSYSAIAPTNYPSLDTDKKYDPYSKMGAQATLEVTFYFSGLSLSLQPTYRNN